MYDLQLTAEQLEIRDTVREFVDAAIKPVCLNADRLDRADRTLPLALLDQASELGLRTLALSEDRGGAGADALTACIVIEELAAGDADIAATLATTSRLSHLLFDCLMSEKQRARFLPSFVEDHRFHLAFAAHEPNHNARLGVNYHRPLANNGAMETTAVRTADGAWLVNGTKYCIANAPIAKLFAVAVDSADGPLVLLIPAGAPGLAIRTLERAWHHGPCGTLELTNCRVESANTIGGGCAALFAADPQVRAINLGIARAAYEAAVAYAKLRIQGGRPIIEHQAIGTKLAEIAIKLEVARAAAWQAAWASDHPQAIADRSLSDLPLQAIAQVFTAEAMLAATKDAAEVFGAMGVMRDMPLQKYVNDARICLHHADVADAKLRIAEALADYRRPAPAAMAAE